LNDIGIEESDINDCIDGSFNDTDHKLADNVLLANERKLFNERSVYSYPELIINGQVYRVIFLLKF
jgi:hypothetical protein